MEVMQLLLPILIGLTMLAVAGALLAGIISMGFEDSISQRLSNNLMRWRVILQGIAITFMILSFFIGF